MRRICDVHCHLIPGVDDGCRDFGMSMELLKMEYHTGVRAIILTPHFRFGMFETPRERVLERYLDLKKRAAAVFPDLFLALGCEYHRSENLAAALQEEPLYRMAGSRFVLLEFSGADTRDIIRRKTAETLAAGLTPIIAHIERYPNLRGLDEIGYLRDAGARIQVNADAVIGKEGFDRKRRMKKMLREGLVDLIGSDAHDTSNRPSRLGECAEYVSKLLGEEETKRLMWENPMKILLSM